MQITTGVEENIQFVQSDMFSNCAKLSFSAIISNPPYIETSIIPTLEKEVRNEPILALDGGEDGLKFYTIILTQAEDYLLSGGYVLLEIGYDQGEKVLNLWRRLKEKNKCGLDIVTKSPIKDLAGNDRVLILKKA